jgi:hypothetical protein
MITPHPSVASRAHDVRDVRRPIFLRDRPNVLQQIFYANRSIKLVCLRHRVRNIHACSAICLQRSYARAIGFAHFGPMISERSASKDLTSMTGTDDVKIIEGVIQSYLDGLYESDAGKIASVFHPTSALTCVGNDGELVITPRDKWLDNVRARPSPKQQGLPRHDQVLTIDLVSPTMAYVKLKCAIPPRFFTDQLSLLKIDGRWQIAQKVFMTEMRE